MSFMQLAGCTCLIQDILRGASQQNGARLRVLAVHDECEELVSNLLHLEEAGPCADVTLLDFLSSALAMATCLMTLQL